MLDFLLMQVVNSDLSTYTLIGKYQMEPIKICTNEDVKKLSNNVSNGGNMAIVTQNVVLNFSCTFKVVLSIFKGSNDQYI